MAFTNEQKSASTTQYLLIEDSFNLLIEDDKVLLIQAPISWSKDIKSPEPTFTNVDKS